MHVSKNGTLVLTRHYLANQYELDEKPGSTREKLYLGGDYYSAGAVLMRDNGGAWQVFYINSDYLGSVTHILNSAGNVVAEYSYDAWGRLRNPVNHVVYGDGQQPELFLGRGYTGHSLSRWFAIGKHLNWFGLINMNRNGAISSGLNHAAHAGFFGEGIAAATVTGRTRHVFGPDAIAIAGSLDVSSGVNLNGSKGGLIILRGKQTGVYGYNDLGSGGGAVSASVGVQKINLYTSVSTNAIEGSNFYGSRYEVNARVGIGIDIGVSVAYSKFDGGFTIGFGNYVGLGVSATLLSFNINKGATVRRIGDLPAGIKKTLERW